MRILHVDTGGAMRGGQHQVLLLHKSLAQGDIDQTLLAGRAIRARHDCEAATWSSIRRHAANCDLIHAHDARAHTMALLFGRCKPVVVARRVAFPVGNGPASRWKYKHAEHFIAISQHVADVLGEGGVDRGKISVIYDAAPDQAIFSASEASEPERSDAFTAVMPDSDDPLKGRDLALDACQRCGVELILSNDLARDIPRADALLYLSQTEGLGSAILLGMLAGLPAIASNVGGIPEALEDGVTGLLVENEAASVAAALTRLREDAELRQRMSKAALEKVKLQFSCNTLARRTAQVYAEVLQRCEVSA